MNTYELSRFFWDFAFENPSKIKPIHCAIYFFSIEHCNRLGWKKEFGLPTSMVIEAIGVKSYSVYKTAFDDLVKYNFFDVIQYSKNQYSSNIIALKDNSKANSKANAKAHTKAHTKALDKATQKHIQKHIQKQSKSIVSINKQETIKPINNINTIKSFDFKKAFLQLDVDSKILEDWLKVRKTKKAVNSETAFNAIKKKMEASGKSFNECVKISAEKSWAGFDIEWTKEKTKYDNSANITKLKGEIVYEQF